MSALLPPSFQRLEQAITGNKLTKVVVNRKDLSTLLTQYNKFRKEIVSNISQGLNPVKAKASPSVSIEPNAPYRGREVSLEQFVIESNRIERITLNPQQLQACIEVHEKLLDHSELTIGRLEAFVAAVQPGAILRDRDGLNVVVGQHVPPFGSPDILKGLNEILAWANSASRHHSQREALFYTHQAYEWLHPFTDGNGRSGRAIWLWMHNQCYGELRLNFLHSWYYASLQASQGQTGPFATRFRTLIQTYKK